MPWPCQGVGRTREIGGGWRCIREEAGRRQDGGSFRRRILQTDPSGRRQDEGDWRRMALHRPEGAASLGGRCIELDASSWTLELDAASSWTLDASWKDRSEGAGKLAHLQHLARLLPVGPLGGRAGVRLARQPPRPARRQRRLHPLRRTGRGVERACGGQSWPATGAVTIDGSGSMRRA